MHNTRGRKGARKNLQAQKSRPVVDIKSIHVARDDRRIHTCFVHFTPSPPNTHPRSLFYSHVSCRICFHTTLVLQSRRHSRYIYLYSFRTGGPKDSSGPGGEMSRHRARRRSPGRFNSQVRLAALATAADHPSVSAVRAPPACVLFTQPPFRFAA